MNGGEALALSFANRKSIRFLLSAAYVASAACFTLLVSMPAPLTTTWIGVAMSVLIVAGFVWRGQWYARFIASFHPLRAVVAIVFAVMLVKAASGYFWQEDPGRSLYAHMSVQTIRYPFFLAATFFAAVSGMLALPSLEGAARMISRRLSRTDRLFLIYGSLIGIVMAACALSIAPKLFMGYDLIYSLDSGYCLKFLYPDPTYAYIHHTLISLLLFPIYAIAHGVSLLLGPSAFIEALVITILNMEIMLVVGVMLRQITQNDDVLALYTVAAPLWMLSICPEKYSVTIFTLVLSIYLYHYRHDRGAKAAAVLATGANSVNILGCIFYTLDAGWKKALPRAAKLAFLFFSLLVVMGRLDILVRFSKHFEWVGIFNQTESSFLYKCYAALDAMAAAIFVLPFEADVQFFWAGIGSRFNVLGALVLTVCLIGLFSKRKERTTVIFGFWMTFLAVLIVILNWAPYESPLFAYSFFWAYVVLFVYGIQHVFRRKPVYAKFALRGLMALCLMMNVYHLTALLTYLA